MNAFIQKFATAIVTTLCCFDRVIFKGYLPFGNDAHLNSFVDRGLRIRRKDFIPMVQEHSETLVQHAKALAGQAGRPYEYRQGRFCKETFIQNIMRRDRITEGLVAVLCCQETCRTVKLRHARHRPELVFAYRPQRVLYYYSIDLAWPSEGGSRRAQKRRLGPLAGYSRSDGQWNRIAPATPSRPM